MASQAGGHGCVSRVQPRVCGLCWRLPPVGPGLFDPGGELTWIFSIILMRLFLLEEIMVYSILQTLGDTCDLLASGLALANAILRTLFLTPCLRYCLGPANIEEPVETGVLTF